MRIWYLLSFLWYFFSFATSLHESIDGEDHGLRLSMISFGDHTKSHLSFNDSSERAFQAAVDELDLFGEPVQFNQLFNDLPNHTKNYRQSARKTIVLFTDGNGVDAPNFEILEGTLPCSQNSFPSAN